MVINEQRQQVADGVPRREMELTNFPFNCLDYGILIGKPCKYGMYPVDPGEEKWLLTSRGQIFVTDYTVYDQNKYCMDVFYNISEFVHNFHLFICFENPSTEKETIRYIIPVFPQLSNILIR